MNSTLQDQARQLLAAAPASVEMPAGAGKTHLLAAAVAVAAADSKRSLVLTHTNAGVDAIRRRLREFGVSPGMARVETITSWAFSLVLAYPHLAGVSVAETPDWSQSDEYLEGATHVAASAAIRDVHTTSFEHLFVDEYQDCTTAHHAFITRLADAIPRSITFGDPLQAIFGFAGPLADWDTDVLSLFPKFPIEAVPHRWKNYNEELGDWLLQIRPLLANGGTFDFSNYEISGLSIVRDTSPQSVAEVAYKFRNFDETVVLLDKWAANVASHASRLGGSYSVMEDISGNFMREQISGSAPNARRNVLPLPQPGDPALARWFAQFAKATVIGLGDINGPVLRRLEQNRSLDGLSRDTIQPTVDALEKLRVTPTYEQLAQTARTVRETKTLKIYRWEAWNDTLAAVALSVENGEAPIDNFGKIRERLRRQGRKSHSRVASRTLLVKGLEYDHVIIANLNEFADPRNLYVALSRARKSVTVIGGSAQLRLRI